MKKKQSQAKPVSSELYTTEASESKKKAKGEVEIPDPTPEEGKKIIEEDDGDPD